MKDDAGKHAVWNEKFTLSNIHAEIGKDEALVLEAMEKDTLTSDFLGSTEPLSFAALAEFEGLCRHDLIIYDKKLQKAGNIKVAT